MKTKNNLIIALCIGLLTMFTVSSCEQKTVKQRCLEGNTKNNPDKYSWVPEQGTLNSHLTPDDVGTCSVKVGTKG